VTPISYILGKVGGKSWRRCSGKCISKKKKKRKMFSGELEL